MKPDGKDPEPVTNDEYNNWFPHLSPDGKWIAFLSYGHDVAPAEHPYYKHVTLRLMPVEGGAPRGDRVRLRRAGHDQRAVVVARRAHARVRQQQRRLLSTDCRSSQRRLGMRGVLHALARAALTQPSWRTARAIAARATR